jgi:hypothetical protein
VPHPTIQVDASPAPAARNQFFDICNHIFFMLETKYIKTILMSHKQFSILEKHYPMHTTNKNLVETKIKRTTNEMKISSHGSKLHGTTSNY